MATILGCDSFDNGTQKAKDVDVFGDSVIPGVTYKHTGAYGCPLAGANAWLRYITYRNK